MKKVASLLMAFTLLGLIQAPQMAHGQEVIKLKMADSFPIGHVGYRASLHFVKSAEEISNQKVKIEYYPAEQLGKLKDLLILCSQGIVDIAYVHPAFYAGQVPLNTVMIMPFFTTAVEGTEIYMRLRDTCPELSQEFLRYGVRPLTVYATNQYDVGTVKKPIRLPEDLKGLRLKTSGGIFDKIAMQYGIIGLVVPSPEIYEATSRGIVEGNILPLPSVKGYRVNELEKYHTLGLRLGSSPNTFQINEKKWQKLPNDIQNALREAAKEHSKYFAENWDKEQLELAQQFEKEGMIIHRIPSEDRDKWNAPLKGIEEIWIQDMEKKKLPGRKVFMEFKRICQEVVK